MHEVVASPPFVESPLIVQVSHVSCQFHGEMENAKKGPQTSKPESKDVAADHDWCALLKLPPPWLNLIHANSLLHRADTSFLCHPV
jgi:hypothetical protein